MKQWRENFPTLTCERQDEEKHTHLVIWQLGIAAIHAEAEDPNWALNLSHDEAKLAARHSLIELNGLPSWMGSLALRHPMAVKYILTKELLSELSEPAKDFSHSMVLQNISHSTEDVATLFVPELAEWLRTNGLTKNPDDNEKGIVSRVGQIITFLTNTEMLKPATSWQPFEEYPDTYGNRSTKSHLATHAD